MIQKLRLAVAALAVLVSFTSCKYVLTTYEPIPPVTKIPDNPTFCYIPSIAERASSTSLDGKRNSKLGHTFVNAARSEGYKAVHASDYRTSYGYDFSSIPEPVVFITFKKVYGNFDYIESANVCIWTNYPSLRFEKNVKPHYYDSCSYEKYATGLIYKLMGKTGYPRTVCVAPMRKNTEAIQAIQLFKLNKLSEARIHAERSVQNFPGDAEAWYLFGIIERELRNHAHSMQCFRKARSLRSCMAYDAAIETGLRYQKAMLNVK